MITRFNGRYAFLSNFFPCKIEHKGITYNNVESFYVAMKINKDQQIEGKYITLIDCRELISKIKDPANVKQFGKRLQLRRDWDLIKLDTMLWAIREKFKNEDLKELLLETGNTPLIEGNFWGDQFWGVYNGTGENHLGKILMKVRDEIRNQNQNQSLEHILFQ